MWTLNIELEQDLNRFLLREWATEMLAGDTCARTTEKFQAWTNIVSFHECHSTQTTEAAKNCSLKQLYKGRSSHIHDVWPYARARAWKRHPDEKLFLFQGKARSEAHYSHFNEYCCPRFKGQQLNSYCAWNENADNFNLGVVCLCRVGFKKKILSMNCH